MYEYKCIEKKFSQPITENSIDNLSNLEYLLNLYSSSGWRLASEIKYDSNSYIFILEREKREILE